MQNLSKTKDKIIQKIETDQDEIEKSNNVRKRKIEVSETSIITKDRSSTVIQSNPNSPKTNIRGSIKSPQKQSFAQRSSINVSTKGISKKRVNFKQKAFIEVVNIESYKKYNLDNCFSENEDKDNTRCRCLIF